MAPVRQNMGDSVPTLQIWASVRPGLKSGVNQNVVSIFCYLVAWQSYHIFAVPNLVGLVKNIDSSDFSIRRKKDNFSPIVSNLKSYALRFSFSRERAVLCACQWVGLIHANTQRIRTPCFNLELKMNVQRNENVTKTETNRRSEEEGTIDQNIKLLTPSHRKTGQEILLLALQDGYRSIMVEEWIKTYRTKTFFELSVVLYRCSWQQPRHLTISECFFDLRHTVTINSSHF